MDTSVLEGLGLSKGEIKIYLTLLSQGATKVGTVIEKSGMASSAVHNSVNSLIDKGLVSYVKKGKIKHYQAVKPKQLVNYVDDKKKKLMKILPELELKQSLSKEKQEAEVFVGKKGIISMYNMLIEDAKKGDDFMFFSMDVKQSNEEIQKFFLSYDVKRKDKGLKIKGLASPNLKKLYTKRKALKMKYPRFPLPANISFCRNKIAMMSWGEKPVGYLITSKQMYGIFKRFFENVWGMS